MMHHYLKIKKQFAEEIVKNNKLFEIRFNDRAYQKGDTVSFEVEMVKAHSIHNRIYQITFVLSSWGLERGHVALGIREVDGNV